MKQFRYLFSLCVCASFGITANAWGNRPLGPYQVGKTANKSHHKQTATNSLLKQAQTRIAVYHSTRKSEKPSAPRRWDQIYIPNLPELEGTAAPPPVSRTTYTIEELTRTWAPYSYP